MSGRAKEANNQMQRTHPTFNIVVVSSDALRRSETILNSNLCVNVSASHK